MSGRDEHRHSICPPIPTHCRRPIRLIMAMFPDCGHAGRVTLPPHVGWARIPAAPNQARSAQGLSKTIVHLHILSTLYSLIHRNSVVPRMFPIVMGVTTIGASFAPQSQSIAVVRSFDYGNDSWLRSRGTRDPTTPQRITYRTRTGRARGPSRARPSATLKSLRFFGGYAFPSQRKSVVPRMFPNRNGRISHISWKVWRSVRSPNHSQSTLL